MSIKSVRKEEISEFFFHDKFDRNSGDNDVGLAKIKETFSGYYADPIPLIQYKLPSGTPVIVSGWGSTKVRRELRLSTGS